MPSERRRILYAPTSAVTAPGDARCVTSTSTRVSTGALSTARSRTATVTGTAPRTTWRSRPRFAVLRTRETTHRCLLRTHRHQTRLRWTHRDLTTRASTDPPAGPAWTGTSAAVAAAAATSPRGAHPEPGCSRSRCSHSCFAAAAELGVRYPARQAVPACGFPQSIGESGSCISRSRSSAGCSRRTS